MSELDIYSTTSSRGMSCSVQLPDGPGILHLSEGLTGIKSFHIARRVWQFALHDVSGESMYQLKWFYQRTISERAACGERHDNMPLLWPPLSR